jgi:putative colanic acid biosynthesis acetyltransferase WcaF
MLATRSEVRLQNFDSKIGLNRGASRLKEGVWYLIKTLFFLSALPYPSRFKVWLLKAFGAEVGSGVVIKPRVNIHMPWKLWIKNNVWIGEEVFILNFEKVTIGNNVCVSQRAFICGGNHDYRVPSMPYRNGPVTLQDGCWVGASCFIGPDVVIGTDSIITAGSVLTGSVDDNGIFRGNPAIKISSRWK